MPEPEAHEHADAYVERLRERGVKYRLTTRYPQSSSHGPGEVVSVNPRGRIDRRDRMNVEVERESDCDITERDDPYKTIDLADVWDRFDGYGPEFPSTFETSEGPTVLRWGTVTGWGSDLEGFGYRKIMGKHGWSRHDLSTRDALLGGIVTPASDPRYTKFTGRTPFRGLGGVACIRVVVVAFDPIGDEPAPAASSRRSAIL